MKQVTSYVGGLGCNVVHATQFQTEHNFGAQALENEIGVRVRGRDVRLGYIKIDRSPEAGKQCYVMTFAHLDVLDEILEVIEEIEADVTGAEEVKRLLQLVVRD